MHVGLLSFRLGGTDGVAVVARHWANVIEGLGHRVTTIAGEGPVDRPVSGLAIEDVTPPDRQAVADAVADVDVVIVENLASLPLRPDATAVVADVLAGRSAILHHHDLPWQRDRFAHIDGWPPTDPAWLHVTINELTRTDLAERGIEARVIRNGFDLDAPLGDRTAGRAAAGVADSERLLMHPVRAIARKAVPDAMALAASLGGTYWLLGGAEEDYGPTLDELLASPPSPTIVGDRGASVADAYAACDVVVFPSTWEGFGNPTIESAHARRPLAIRRYPVAAELFAMGFRFFDVDDPADVAELAAHMDDPVGFATIADANESIAREHFGLDRLARDVSRALADVVG